MKHRFVALSVLCVAALIAAGCSSKSPGTQESDDNAPVVTQQTAHAEDAADTSAGTADGTGAATGQTSDFPLDDLTSAQSELGDLSGLLSDECLAVAGLSMTVGLLLAAPFMGQSELTADDVSQAFDGLDKVPPELQDAMKVLHDAAMAATGKTLAEAATILGSDKVSAAFEQLSTYLSAHCDGG